MIDKFQYDWIIMANKEKGMDDISARKAAIRWAADQLQKQKHNQGIIDKYAPYKVGRVHNSVDEYISPKMTPNQMVRAAQKAVGNIPGGLLSEEGPGQMAPPSLLEGAYVNKIPSQQDMWRKEVGVSALEGPETANMQPSPYELTLLAENQQRHAPVPPPLPGVSNPDYPRFPAANQMGVAKGYDHQRVNPPPSVTGMYAPGQGPLASDPGPTPQQVGWGGDMSPAEKNQYIQALGFLQKQLAKDRQKQPVQWMQMVPPRRRR